MRSLTALALMAIALPALTVPAAAQYYESADLPGVRVTIQPRSFLDPGTKARPRTGRTAACSAPCATGSEGGGVLGATAGGCPGAYGQACGGGPRQKGGRTGPRPPHCRSATRAQGGSRRG